MFKNFERLKRLINKIFDITSALSEVSQSEI